MGVARGTRKRWIPRWSRQAAFLGESGSLLPTIVGILLFFAAIFALMAFAMTWFIRHGLQ